MLLFDLYSLLLGNQKLICWLSVDGNAAAVPFYFQNATARTLCENAQTFPSFVPEDHVRKYHGFCTVRSEKLSVKMNCFAKHLTSSVRPK